MSRRKQAGNALIEFTLAAIPLIFFMLSLVELSRGMWISAPWPTASRMAPASPPCMERAAPKLPAPAPYRWAPWATAIQQAAVGLDPGQFNLVPSSGGVSQSCAPLSTCLASTTTWRPANNSVGTALRISGSYPFRSSFMQFAPLNLGAESQEEVSFCHAASELIE